MTTTLIIFGILTVFVVGFIQVYKRHYSVVKKIDFADKYRSKFVDFVNNYSCDQWNRSVSFDEEFMVG